MLILGINLPGVSDQVQCQLRVASQSRLVINSDGLFITATVLTPLPMAVPCVVTECGSTLETQAPLSDSDPLRT